MKRNTFFKLDKTTTFLKIYCDPFRVSLGVFVSYNIECDVDLFSNVWCVRLTKWSEKIVDCSGVLLYRILLICK